MSEAKLKELEARIEKLEHALLVLSSWSDGCASYVRAILGPEATQVWEAIDEE